MSEPMKKPGHAPESYDPKDVPEIVKLAAEQPALEKQGKQRVEPVTFMQKGEFLLGGFHVGPDIGKRWKKYEREEKKAPLTNTVDGTGFERRLLPTASVAAEKRMWNFTGVAVTDRNILPNYELLAIPPAYYAVFEIDCNADIDRQFDEVDLWLVEHQGEYKRKKWDNGDDYYYLLWAGRYEDERIEEMWVPFDTPSHAPASYDPKDMPEIVRMAVVQGGASETAHSPAAQPRIIRRDTMRIVGTTGDGAKTGKVWSNFEGTYSKTPFPKNDESSYEIRFWQSRLTGKTPDSKKSVHVGHLTNPTVDSKAYSAVELPAAEYAMFDVYVAKGYDSGNEAMEQWLADNADTYRMLEFDGYEYVIECYNEKFKDGNRPDSIVEIWIPLERVQPESYDPKDVPEIVRLAAARGRRSLASPTP